MMVVKIRRIGFSVSAQEAFFRACYLHQACEVLIKALSMVGGDISRFRLVKPERESGYRDAMYTSEVYNYDGKTEWQGLRAGWINSHPTTNSDDKPIDSFPWTSEFDSCAREVGLQ